MAAVGLAEVVFVGVCIAQVEGDVLGDGVGGAGVPGRVVPHTIRLPGARRGCFPTLFLGSRTEQGGFRELRHSAN